MRRPLRRGSNGSRMPLWLLCFRNLHRLQRQRLRQLQFLRLHLRQHPRQHPRLYRSPQPIMRTRSPRMKSPMTRTRTRSPGMRSLGGRMSRLGSSLLGKMVDHHHHHRCRQSMMRTRSPKMRSPRRRMSRLEISLLGKTAGRVLMGRLLRVSKMAMERRVRSRVRTAKGAKTEMTNRDPQTKKKRRRRRRKRRGKKTSHLTLPKPQTNLPPTPKETAPWLQHKHDSRQSTPPLLSPLNLKKPPSENPTTPTRPTRTRRLKTKETAAPRVWPEGKWPKKKLEASRLKLRSSMPKSPLLEPSPQRTSDTRTR